MKGKEKKTKEKKEIEKKGKEMKGKERKRKEKNRWEGRKLGKERRHSHICYYKIKISYPIVSTSRS